VIVPSPKTIITYYIDHDPAVCSGACTYVFAVENVKSSDLWVSQIISEAFDDPGNIFLSRSYANAISFGSYFDYELSPYFGSNSETLPFLKELKI
jgi:hypothetical protein